MTEQNQTVEDSDEYKELLRLNGVILDTFIQTNNELARQKKINENLQLQVKQLESTNQYPKTIK